MPGGVVDSCIWTPGQRQQPRLEQFGVGSCPEGGMSRDAIRNIIVGLILLAITALLRPVVTGAVDWGMDQLLD